MDAELGDASNAADDRPIAVRRKRRSSSVLSQPVEPNANAGPYQPQHDHNDSTGSGEPSKTPSKPKKRVRFSDPTPEVSAPSSSTGLTPYMSRTHFETRSRDARDSSPPLRPQARRRLSLPSSGFTALPSPSLSPSPTSPAPMSGEVQFAPLRQVLDGRIRRRLRRNNLSEELNSIDAEKRTEASWRREIQDLKDEIEALRQGEDGQEEGTKAEESTTARIQQLEHELQELKQEESPDFGILQRPTIDESGIFMDETAGDFVDANFDESEALQDRTQMEAARTVSHMATQASLGPLYDQKTLREARLSLEYLFPGEIALGLIPDDPKPLLDIMLDRLQVLKTQALIAEDALSTTQMQESNLRTQFNAVLEQLDRSRRYAEKISAKHAKEKARADSSQIQVQGFEKKTDDTASHIESLETECREKEGSLTKLRAALDSYRVECGKLEELINRIETEHREEVSAVRMEMDEAVADLECHVAAETTGRREAEQSLADRDAKIAELRNREQDLLNAVNEKQSVIRDLETASSSEHSKHEQSLGSLNVQMARVAGELSDTRQHLKDSNEYRWHAEQTCAILMQKLEEEKDAGLRAVMAVQAELAQCSTNAEDIKVAHEGDSKRRGAEVAEHKGLLTPISATRFKDVGVHFEGDDAHVDGYVELKRGRSQNLKLRRRPDSGIGVLEEDEEEYEEGMHA